jgi:hypothetical protein
LVIFLPSNSPASLKIRREYPRSKSTGLILLKIKPQNLRDWEALSSIDSIDSMV